MYLILVASLNNNMKLAKTLQEQMSTLECDCKIVNLVELNLPMYDSDKEENDGIPEKIDSLLEKMEEAGGYIVVAPEYNYSIPPVLTNTVAWISRSGDDFRKYFNGKIVQLSTHSGGGGNDVMNAMRTQFNKLGSVVMPREIIVTYQKSLNEKSSLKTLDSFVELTKK